jgi:CrcB protein
MFNCSTARPSRHHRPKSFENQPTPRSLLTRNVPYDTIGRHQKRFALSKRSSPLHDYLQVLKNLTLVAAGGAVGAVSRYAISGLTHRILSTSFPLGTLAVNTTGCLLIGFLLETANQTTWISDSWRLALGIGFLGALTTFSTFGYETLELVKESQWTLALANIATNVLIGLFSVWLGVIVARLITG